MTLVILAQITAAEGKEELVRNALEKLVEPSLKDEGCIRYDFHRDNENPAYFVFYEIWETRDLWLKHMDTPHLAAYKSATEGAVADFKLNELTRIS
ncbi:MULTISPECIES: putative quinol monooxygenase [unclassified Lentilitoribacter]|uniref:putative quinol monooxygenase n=1 Tax=unclassified Lentilitoribacter TaxID=2647570 RepID=UPI0013A6B80E|nr:putative quinol monooxygenase [Lentilitoribacter sp. Alg239-R112]